MYHSEVSRTFSNAFDERFHTIVLSASFLKNHIAFNFHNP